MVEEDMIPEMGDGPVETVDSMNEEFLKWKQQNQNQMWKWKDQNQNLQWKKNPCSEPNRWFTIRTNNRRRTPVEETPTEDTSTTNDTPVESAEETTAQKLIQIHLFLHHP